MINSLITIIDGKKSFIFINFINRNRGRASLKDRVAPVVDTCTRVVDAENPEKNLQTNADWIGLLAGSAFSGSKLGCPPLCYG